VAWNFTGTRLASGSVDQTARIWNIDPRGLHAPEIELRGHAGAIDQLTWSTVADNIVATASEDKTVKVWDTRTVKAVATINTGGQNINIAWSPDGNNIAVGNKKDVVSIIDARKYKIVKEHKFAYEVNEMCWHRSGEHFLLTTGNGSIEILSFPDFEDVSTVHAHGGQCFALDFDPRGRYLATGGADALVDIWDLSEMVCVRTIDRLDAPIRSLSFSHDGQFLATGSEDLRIDIADAETGEHVHTVEMRGAMSSLAFNPKCLLLAWATEPEPGSRHLGPVSVFGFAS